MKFTQTHPAGGDGTAPYDVTFYPTKVTDFIDEVLTHKTDWGTISIIGYGSVEYKYGQLIGNIPNEWNNLMINKVDAAGGWSRMDFRLFVYPLSQRSHEIY